MQGLEPGPLQVTGLCRGRVKFFVRFSFENVVWHGCYKMGVQGGFDRMSAAADFDPEEGLHGPQIGASVVISCFYTLFTRGPLSFKKLSL